MKSETSKSMQTEIPVVASPSPGAEILTVVAPAVLPFMFTLQWHKNAARRQGSPAEKLYLRYLGEYSARLIDILWNFILRYVLQ